MARPATDTRSGHVSVAASCNDYRVWSVGFAELGNMYVANKRRMYGKQRHLRVGTSCALDLPHVHVSQPNAGRQTGKARKRALCNRQVGWGLGIGRGHPSAPGPWKWP